MPSKELPVIGTRELVTFIDDGVIDVPAKVDTGADFSAVWASDIREQDGALLFKLFGVGSGYFTGRDVRSEEFKVTEVKNSFGHSEMRYKVKMRIGILNKRIKIEVNLADRSRNRYPMLIGKRTIAGKFLVDPSQKQRTATKKQKQRVLILNCKDSDIVSDFARNLSDSTRNLQCDYSTYDDLVITLENDKPMQVVDHKTNRSLSEYDLVYFKTHFARAEFSAAIVEYLDSIGRAYIDEEVALYRSNTKVSQYAKLNRYGLPIPKTLMINNAILTTQFTRFKDALGLPFVLKDPAADKGLTNYLVKNEADFDKIVSHTPHDQKYFVAQQYIENDGDYRFIVLNKEVEMIIQRRTDNVDTHLHNTSTGGKATLLEPTTFPGTASAIAVRAAIIMKRQVAGVDLMQDVSTKQWYILEVNNSPQLASGAFMDKKIDIFGKFLRNHAAK